MSLAELQAMAGPHHLQTVAKTVQRHGLTVVAPLFLQIRSFGTGNHFHISLPSLKRHKFDIIHLGGALEQLRNLGEEPEYAYVMQYLAKHDYDMDKTLLKTISHGGCLLREEATLKLLEHNSYDVDLTIRQIDSLCGEYNTERKTTNINRLRRRPSLTGDLTPERRWSTSSLAIDLAAGMRGSTSSVTIDRASTMAESYRETALFICLLPDTPCLTLKVLQRTNYDYRATIDGI
ncbi:hypothetical protein PIIN_00379 [Serendipita indica DSM 11827]|uniref:Uncharacterized protein n=1 Tax=Serendipita indica (strain DSM 11827) TaxID=1109443 RepID=G4T5V6_SERID|nr:hypothetical protein PIIN_00379 [Serendipita indica DSM 11827]